MEATWAPEATVSRRASVLDFAEEARAASRTSLTRDICGLVFVCWALMVPMCLPSAEADAQTYLGARVGPGDVLISARACVGEEGFENLGACAAITSVHARRAARRGMSVGQMARAYSFALKRPQRPWVPFLRDRAQPPRHWPNSSWSWRRPHFAALVRHVERLFRGEVSDPCEDDAPLHYGGPQDGGLGDGWDRVECVESRTRFYARGRR